MKTVATLFKDELATPAPAGLVPRIYARIEEEHARGIRQNRAIWGAVSLASLGTLALSSVYAVHAFSASSFGSYFSIIFSDIGSLSSFWRELSLSLIESLPIVGVVCILGSVFLVLWSIRKFAKKTDTTSDIFISSLTAHSV